jgi:hypothetical protein
MLATSIRQPSRPLSSQRRMTASIRLRSSSLRQSSFGSVRTPNQAS